MPLKHADIWRAIDRLAEKNGLSASGLAKKAGLSPTIFNPSKRLSKQRKRWPSTESIARILQATSMDLDAFVTLARSDASGPPNLTLPFLTYGQALRPGAFTEEGYPAGSSWEKIQFPALTDPFAFAIEISGKSMEPLYREGDRISVSPAEKPRRGDRVLVRNARGELLVKQLGRESTQKVELLSLHSPFVPLTIAREDIMWIYRIVSVSQ